MAAAECADLEEDHEVSVGKYTFCSHFDSGNGQRWSVKDGEYTCWTRPDCEGSAEETGFKTWFYFYIKGGVKGETITLRVRGVNAHSKLYGRDMRPVVRSHPSEDKFDRVRSSVEYKQDEEKEKIEVKLKHRFEYTGETTYIAFTYPYSYKDGQDRLDALDKTYENHTSIYFHRELLCESLENRKIELLTITSRKGIEATKEPVLDQLCPDGPDARPFEFGKRPVIFVSARVHPGEVPAQWTLEGVIKFVLDPNDPRAEALREMYIIKIIPMLNPDGVFHGHYRADTQGLNLNRFYADPDRATHPGIFGAKEVMMTLHAQGRLEYYYDLHAHACRRGCFIYGNALPDVRQQIENVLLIRLIALNTPHLDFSGCNFSERNMKAKDKGDGLSKEGSGRVGMYKHTDLPHCYTLECNYNTGRIVNATPDAATSDGRCSPGRAPDRRLQPPKYTPESFMHVGKALVVAVCDHKGINPWSRLPNSHAGSLEGLRAVVANGLAYSKSALAQDYRMQIKEHNINTKPEKKPKEPEKPTSNRASKPKQLSSRKATPVTPHAKVPPEELETEAQPAKKAAPLPRVAQMASNNIERRRRPPVIRQPLQFVADKAVAVPVLDEAARGLLQQRQQHHPSGLHQAFQVNQLNQLKSVALDNPSVFVSNLVLQPQAKGRAAARLMNRNAKNDCAPRYANRLSLRARGAPASMQLLSELVPESTKSDPGSWDQHMDQEIGSARARLAEWTVGNADGE